MKKSPFYNYRNASLTLKIPGAGNLIVDPETGNVSPVIQSIKYSALLKSKPSKDDIKLRELAGVDAASAYVEGWLIGTINNLGEIQGLETAYFPEGVKVPLEVEAEVNGSVGRLQILPWIASPYKVDSYTGQKILGYFSHSKGK